MQTIEKDLSAVSTGLHTAWRGALRITNNVNEQSPLLHTIITYYHEHSLYFDCITVRLKLS